MSSSHSRSIGLFDVILGAVLFYILTIGIQSLLDIAVPGLLKPETLKQIQVSGGLFFLVWAVLGNLIFKPFLDLIIERENKTLGFSNNAAELRREISALEQSIEAQLQDARIEGLKNKERITASARMKAQAQYEDMEVKAREYLLSAQKEVALLKEKAEHELLIEAKKLSQEVFSKVLSPVIVENKHILH